MEGQSGEERRERPNIIFRILQGSLMALFHATRIMFYVFPPSVMYAIFRGIAAALLLARPGMRRRLEARIAEALPEMGDARKISAVARGACASAFVPMLDVFTLGREGERYMRELCVEGEEHLDRAAALGKGIILVGAHLGAVAIAHAVMARRGRPYTPITYNPADTPVPRYVEALQYYAGLLGCDPEEPAFLAGKDIIHRVIEHLKKGKWIGLTFDVPGTGVVQLFGKPAAVASGWAHFSYDTGAPVVPLALLRGKHPCDNLLTFQPPVFSDATAERKEEVARIMGETIAAVEKLIRQAPEQWMGWFGLPAWQKQAQEILGKAPSR